MGRRTVATDPATGRAALQPRRRVVITPRAEHEVRAHLEPRTLKIGREIEPRLSVQDEGELTRQAHERQHQDDARRRQTFIEHLQAADQEVRAAAESWRPDDPMSRREVQKIGALIRRQLGRHSS